MRQCAPLLAISLMCGILSAGTALGCAVKLKPSLAIVSIGSNDVVPTVLDGVPPTDPAIFQAEYRQLVYTLKQAGAEVIVANVPDVTLAPVLRSYSQFEAGCGVPPSGATPADYVVPNFTNPTLSSFNLCTNYSVRSAADPLIFLQFCYFVGE